MSMVTLAISYLTTSNLPWSMDLTFKAPMQYCSLQHQTLLPWLRSVKYIGNRDSVRLRKCRTRQHSFKRGRFPAVSYKVPWSRSGATAWASKPHKKTQTWRGAGHHLNSMSNTLCFQQIAETGWTFTQTLVCMSKMMTPLPKHTHTYKHIHTARGYGVMCSEVFWKDQRNLLQLAQKLLERARKKRWPRVFVTIRNWSWKKYFHVWLEFPTYTNMISGGLGLQLLEAGL